MHFIYATSEVAIDIPRDPTSCTFPDLDANPIFLDVPRKNSFSPENAHDCIISAPVLKLFVEEPPEPLASQRQALPVGEQHSFHTNMISCSTYNILDGGYFLLSMCRVLVSVQ